MADKKRVFTVLVIDGGGVRGVIPGRVLEEIETRTGKPCSELFDMVSGISTGAIIAGGLAVPDPQNPGKPLYTAQTLKEFYYKFAPGIFPETKFKSLRQLSSASAYDPKALEAALERSYGDMRLRDSLMHLMIPTTDIKNFRPVWIKHIKGQKDTSPEGWSSMLLRDAVRATTTVPTYFPAKYFETQPNPDMPEIIHRHALIDGGFFGGNTLRRVLTQAKKLAPPDAEIVIVHLGTGLTQNSLSPAEFNKLGPLGLISKSKGNILMSLFLEMTTFDVEEDVREEIGDNLITIDGFIDFLDRKASPSLSLDDASNANLQKLERHAERVIAEKEVEFTRLCDILDRRAMEENRHHESKQALQQLAAHLDTIKTVKSLTRSYRQILHYTARLPDEKGVDVDPQLKALAEKLGSGHKDDLDKIYHVAKDKLRNQSALGNTVREKTDTFGKLLKKISGAFNDKATPPVPPQEAPKEPPVNDNDQKPKDAPPKSAPHRWRW